VDGTPHDANLVDDLVRQVQALDDADLRRLARARAQVDESFHSGAWRSAVEMAATKGGAHAEAWVRIGAAFVPERLEELVQLGATADPEEVAEWQGVARLARLAIDDRLLALLTADSIKPPDLRELSAPWKAMLEAADPADA
jgi:hypothetical protein